LPRNDSCIYNYSAIAWRLHAQYCTYYNTMDIKKKKKKKGPIGLSQLKDIYGLYP